MKRKFIFILVLLISITIFFNSCLKLEFFNESPVRSDNSEISQDLAEITPQEKNETQITISAPETDPILKKDFVINKNTKKFHFSSCYYVDLMKEENKIFVSSTYQDLIDDDYSPCTKCQ